MIKLTLHTIIVPTFLRFANESKVKYEKEKKSYNTWIVTFWPISDIDWFLVGFLCGQFELNDENIEI